MMLDLKVCTAYFMHTACPGNTLCQSGCMILENGFSLINAGYVIFIFGW